MSIVKERINKMARTMCGYYYDGKCSIHHGAGCASIGCEDCYYKKYAMTLFKAGYIHISDCENIFKRERILSQLELLHGLKTKGVKWCTQTCDFSKLLDASEQKLQIEKRRLKNNNGRI